jgi:hypothetical protein
MATFNLTIALGNDAMQNGDDIAEALRHTASRVEAGGLETLQSGPVRDLNGNTVGSWEVRDDG